MDLNKLSEAQFAKVWRELVKKIKEDPIQNFIKASGFMDFTPTPAQTVALKIIFNKQLDPIVKHKIWMEKIDENDVMDLFYVEMTETELYHFMTNRVYDPKCVEEAQVFNMIDLVIGRRGGKTTLSAMLAIYCAISTNWKPFLRKTPFATVLVLSHTREFSDEIIELIRSLVEASPILSRLINKKKRNTASTLNLKVPWIVDNKLEHSRVQIKTSAASSKSTRGVAACAVLCDEIAYWNLDENLKETDEKIMKAVRPATKQFGRSALIIKLSSPGIKQGVLYNEYLRWGKGDLPKNYVVFKAPSWVWNTILPKEEFIIEYELDKDGFDTEYRANFVDSISNFISPEFVDLAVLDTVKFRAPEPEKDIKYFAAIDAAFKKDRFTFSLVGVSENRVTQFVSKGWEGTRQNPVKAHEVAEYIKNILKQFPVDFVSADQFAFQPLKEIFDQYNVTLEESVFTPTFKKKIYFNLKKLVHSQQLDMLDNATQTKEIKELIVEVAASGTIKIGHPTGGSDDFSDSLAIASFYATEGQSTGKFAFDTSTPVKSYGVKSDVNGTAFTAPSADMLVQSGHLTANVVDNSDLYVRDPETGKLVRSTTLEDDDDGPCFSF